MKKGTNEKIREEIMKQNQKKKEKTRKQIKTKGYTSPGLRVVDKENDLNTSKAKYSTQVLVGQKVCPNPESCRVF
jgi:hypothetical protein